MSKAKPNPPEPDQAELLERLVLAVEKIALELQIIREDLDRIQDDFSWALKNALLRPNSGPPLHITSMPADPLAKDFHERVNKYKADDIRPPETPKPRRPADPQVNPGQASQGKLF